MSVCARCSSTSSSSSSTTSIISFSSTALSLVVVALVLLGGATAVSDPNPTVTLPNGVSLRGTTASSGTVNTFLGIPYAMPPVDERRWRPPQPWTPDTSDTPGMLNTSSFGQACTQTKHGVLYGGEDCLFLNVFTHTNRNLIEIGDELLPVAFWIHGGTYISGDGSQYDAQELINFYNGSVIIVTINYRLNIFGFLGSSELRTLDAERGSTGTLGLQDQRLAMKWVQDNIVAFGGDKDRVTLFGQSAGAGSISCHLSMQRSQGLFSAAVMESGGFASWIVQNSTYTQRVYNEVLQETSCMNITCLLGLSTSELFSTMLMIDPVNELFPTAFIPSVDSVELFTHPWVSLSSENISNIPIIIGTNSDEGVSYLPTTVPATLTEFEFFYLLVRVFDFGDYRDEIEEIYLTNATYPETYSGSGELYSKYWWAAQRFVGDYFFSCPAQYSLDQLVLDADTSLSCESYPDHSFCSDMFLYHDNYVLVNRGPFVEHGFELPLVFHFEDEMTTVAEVKMSDIVATYWGNFFVANDPSSNRVGLSSDSNANLLTWNHYSHSVSETVTFSNKLNVSITKNLKKRECSVLNVMMRETMRRDFSHSFADENNGNKDSSSKDFSRSVGDLGLILILCGGCLLVWGVYWAYQRKFGFSHVEAQRFLALQAAEPKSDCAQQCSRFVSPFEL